MATNLRPPTRRTGDIGEYASWHDWPHGATGPASQKSQRELEFEAGQKAAARHRDASPTCHRRSPAAQTTFYPVSTHTYRPDAEAAGVGTPEPCGAEQQHAENADLRPNQRVRSGVAATAARPPAGSTGPTGRRGSCAANAGQERSGTSPQSSTKRSTLRKAYIRAGWHVFPANRREKTPKTGLVMDKAEVDAGRGANNISTRISTTSWSHSARRAAEI